MLCLVYNVITKTNVCTITPNAVTRRLDTVTVNTVEGGKRSEADINDKAET